MQFLSLLAGLLKRFGPVGLGLSMVAAGLYEGLGRFVDERLVHMAVLCLGGLALMLFGGKMKAATDLMVASEAEKRIRSTVMPSESAIPVIQAEIQKQRAGVSRDTRS
jgi:hypothetical protein